MAAGQEIDARFISILPSFKGFGKAVDQSVTGEAKRAGTQFGKAFTAGAEQSAKSIEELQRRQSQAVQKATSDIRKARQDQEAAARKVAIEEKKLEELRSNSKAKSSQLLAAEDRLANAKRKSAEASGALAAASTKSNQLLERQRVELDKAKVGADKAGQSFQTLGKRVKESSDQAAKPGMFGKVAKEAEKAGRDSGTRLSAGISSGVKKGVGRAGSIIKTGLLAATAAAVAGVAVTIQKGFSRLTNIENATAKLTGLGNSAKSVDRIMKNALTSVKGTAFGLDEAATTAAGAVAAGIKPGKELEKTLKTVADAATIGGTSMSEMGAIFNKVATSNKIQGDVIAQLSDKGIPIVKLLADELGVTAAEVTNLASKGKIDFATFQRAMEKGVGGAAQKSGKTTEGAFKNMNAALGRVGASLLKGLFPSLGKGFNRVTGWLDKLTPVAEGFGTKVSAGLSEAERVAGPFFAKVGKGAKGLYDLLVKGDFTKGFRQAFGVTEDSQVVDFLFDVRDAVKSAAPAAKSLTTQLRPVFDLLGSYAKGQGENFLVMFNGLRAAASPLVDTFKKTLLPTLQSFGRFLLDTGRTVVPILLKVFNHVATVVSTTVAPAISGFLQSVMKVVQVVLPIIQQVVGTIVGAVKTQLPVIMPIIQEIGSIFSEVFGLISQKVTQFATTFRQVWSVIGPYVLPILSTLIKTIIGIIGGLVKVVGGLVKLLVGIFTGDFSKMKAGVIAIFGGLKTVVVKLVSGLWSIIKTLFGGAAKWVVTKVTGLATSVAIGFSLLKTRATSILATAVSDIRAKFAQVTEFILAPIRKARDAVGGVMSGLRSKIGDGAEAAGRAFDSIREAAKKPIRFVVETILENGILGAFRKIASTVGLNGLAEKMHVALPQGFARGGVIPGQSSMAGGDTHLRPMREGEGVLVSEGLRDRQSRSLFLRANDAARRGVSFAKFLSGGYAKGGIVGGAGRFSKLFESRLLAASAMAGQTIQAFQRGFRPSTSYSGTSHAGDAIDLQVSSRLLTALRAVGVAAWDRTGKGNWVPHIHGVPIPGAGFAGGSGVWQAQDYLRGGDGLGGRDNGPRVGANLPDGAGTDSGWLKIFTNPLGALKDAFSAPLNKVKEIASNPLGEVVGGAAKHIAGEVISAAPKLLTSAIPGFARGTLSAPRGLGWVGEQGPELMSFRGGETVIPNRKSMQIAGLAQMMQGAGREVVAGLILGMDRNPEKVQKAAADLAAMVTDTAKAELGIASPSKVFVQVGRWVNEGLAVGVKGTSAKVVATIKTLRTNMEKVWSDRKSTSKKGAVAYWQAEVKRLTAAVRKDKKNKSLQSALKAAQGRLTSARKGDTYAGVAAQWDKFSKRTKKTTDALKRNAAARAKVADQLKSAQAKLVDAVKVRNEFRTGVRDQAVESASVVGKGSYAPDIIGNLRTRLASWKKFGENLAKLRKLGLGNQAYSEIVAAGPDEGGKAAEALLASGSSSITQVNDLQKQIRAIGDKVGKDAAGVLYQPGVDAAQGLVDGLKKKQKQLAEAGSVLAKALVAAVKKELKIKSPSKVLFEQGEFTGEGFALGVDSTRQQVVSAGHNMAAAAVPAVPNGSGVPMQVLVQNPWTGEYLMARAEQVADQRIKTNARQTAGSRSS